MVNQLNGFAVISLNGGYRISYTYDVIDNNGNLVNSNVKKSFFAVGDFLSKLEEVVTLVENRMNQES